MPKARGHLAAVALHNIEPSQVCLECWHTLREIHLESEEHVLIECRLYAHARQALLSELSHTMASHMGQSYCARTKLARLFETRSQEDWSAIGRFVAKVRQTRRAMRRRFETRSQKLTRTSYSQRKLTWRASGHHVCRHGVFFRCSPTAGCACMTLDPDFDWRSAEFMPTLDVDLKAITTTSFELSSYTRIGKLLTEVQRRGW